jgi:heme-degrading monooxygenase HmoA
VADYTHSRFDARQRRQIAEGIKRHLHEVGLSRKKLVRHDLKLSTINKALTGQFSDGTLAKLEAILGRRFEPAEPKGSVPSEAPIALGGYSLSATSGFQGRYLCVRPNLGNAEEITAYLIIIRWDEEQSCLVFEEQSRPDAKHAQGGQVYVGFGTSFISLVTVDRGTVRLLMISQPDPGGISRGIILTFYNPQGTLLTPVSAPVVLRRLTDAENPPLGYLHSGMPGHESYKELINSVIADGYVRIIAGVG